MVLFIIDTWKGKPTIDLWEKIWMHASPNLVPPQLYNGYVSTWVPQLANNLTYGKDITSFLHLTCYVSTWVSPFTHVRFLLVCWTMLLVAKPRFQEWPDLVLYLRGCFFAIKADLKARRYLHEFSRYYRCSLCSDSLIANFSGAMAGVLNESKWGWNRVGFVPRIFKSRDALTTPNSTSRYTFKVTNFWTSAEMRVVQYCYLWPIHQFHFNIFLGLVLNIESQGCVIHAWLLSPKGSIP